MDQLYPAFIRLTVYDVATLAAWVWNGSAWVMIGPRIIDASATYDPPSIAAGAGVTTTVAFTGAAIGDFVRASFSLDLQGIAFTAWVSAAGTVSARFQNGTAGAIDLASGTLRVRLTGATGAQLSTTQPTSGLAAILDDDAESVYVVDACSAGAFSGLEGQVPARFQLRRDLLPGVDIGEATVTYVIEGGTAQSSDVVGGFRTSSVTFVAGEFETVVRIASTDDVLSEGNETVRLRLTSATGAQLSTTQPIFAVADILDNDDVLTGGTGADIMEGGAGEDTRAKKDRARGRAAAPGRPDPA